MDEYTIETDITYQNMPRFTVFIIGDDVYNSEVYNDDVYHVDNNKNKKVTFNEIVTIYTYKYKKKQKRYGFISNIKTVSKNIFRTSSKTTNVFTN
jgi:hypothetical protein